MEEELPKGRGSQTLERAPFFLLFFASNWCHYKRAWAPLSCSFGPLGCSFGRLSQPPMASLRSSSGVNLIGGQRAPIGRRI